MKFMLRQEAPEDSFLMVFTETLSAYIMIADINLPAASIQKLYQTHVKRLSTKGRLPPFWKNPRTLGNDLLTPAEQEAYSSKVDAARPILPNIIGRDIALEQVAEFVSVESQLSEAIFSKGDRDHLSSVSDKRAYAESLSADDCGSWPLSLENRHKMRLPFRLLFFHKIFRGKFGVSPRRSGCKTQISVTTDFPE